MNPARCVPTGRCVMNRKLTSRNPRALNEVRVETRTGSRGKEGKTACAQRQTGSGYLQRPVKTSDAECLVLVLVLERRVVQNINHRSGHRPAAPGHGVEQWLQPPWTSSKRRVNGGHSHTPHGQWTQHYDLS